MKYCSSRQQRHEWDSHSKRERERESYGGVSWYENIVNNWANNTQFMLVTNPPSIGEWKETKARLLNLLLWCEYWSCLVEIRKCHLTQSTITLNNRYLIHAKRTNWNHLQWLARILQRILHPRQLRQFVQWISGKLYYFSLKMFSMIIAEILTPFNSNFFCKSEGYCT